MTGEVRFVVEGDTAKVYGQVNGKAIEEDNQITRCIKLTGQTQKEITDELKAMVTKTPDTTLQQFDDLNLKGLEGTDI